MLWYIVGDLGEIMNYKFTVGRRAREEEYIPNNYEIIDLDIYRPNKPIVLVLGGNGSTDDRASNGNAKIVSSMLGVFNKDVDILSVNYNQALGEPKLTENCNELVTKLLIPYVSINGMRIDIDSACKNMRNITIFGHCRGVDGVMKRLISILNQQLLDLQYNDIECRLLISQIVMVSYGANFNAKINAVKGVYCLSFTDDVYPKGSIQASSHFFNNLDIINMVKTDKELLNLIDTKTRPNLIWKQLTNFLRLHRRVYNARENNNIRLFAYGLIQTGNLLWGADHSIHALARDVDYNAHKNASSTGDCISRCLACALCNSVANSIINHKSDKFKNFDMEVLQQQIDTICKHDNYEQTKLDNIDLEDNLDMRL